MPLEIEHDPSSQPADPKAIEAVVRREARDVYAWSNGPGDVYAEHDHPYTKLLYCTQGSIDFIVGPRRIALRAGDRLVLPARTRHSAVVGDGGCSCVEGKLP